MMSQTTVSALPRKSGNQFLNIAAQARISHYRRAAQRAAEQLRQTHRSLRKRPDDTQPPLRLIASWNGDLETLSDFIEMASDWGPFELSSVATMEPTERNAPKKFLCHFDYHASPEIRAHHEAELLDVLRRITAWEREPADASLSNT